MKLLHVKASRRLQQGGFSMIETIIAIAVSGLVVYGGASLVGTTAGLQGGSDQQSLLDREFAAGIQLANNPEKLRPFVGLETMKDCLIRDDGKDCAKFANGEWHQYHSPGENAPSFSLSLRATGRCLEVGDDPLCLVRREMFYRWICTAKACSALETKVSVSPLGKSAEKFRVRVSVIKLDRRQFLTRAQIDFICDSPSNRRSVTGVDYYRLGDICKTIEASKCDLPHQTYQTHGNDCRAPLAAACANGFSQAGLDEASGSCAPAPGGRTVAGRRQDTDTKTTTATKTLVTTDTITNTQTQTVVNNSTPAETAHTPSKVADPQPPVPNLNPAPAIGRWYVDNAQQNSQTLGTYDACPFFSFAQAGSCTAGKTCAKMATNGGGMTNTGWVIYQCQ